MSNACSAETLSIMNATTKKVNSNQNGTPTLLVVKEL